MATISAMAGQAAIPSYGGTVFISYARTDDEKPPFDDATQGWVTFFWQQLRWELNNAGLHQAKLWLDRYEIEPAEEFTEKIDHALRNAQLMVPVLSGNWIQRDYCQRELSRFIELKGNRSDDVVLVKKQEPPQLPAALRNREGYQFFARDQSGRTNEFYWRGLKDQGAYFDMLRRVTEWIAARLIAGAGQSGGPAPRRNRVVFLAAPADELRDAWERLANDLEAVGFTVVPRTGRLPDLAARAVASIEEALAGAEMSVHFLGTAEGARPDGSDETATRLQLRLARAWAATHPGLQRVLWAPKWLPEASGKRDPFEVVARFGGLVDGEQVYAEEVTDLSQWLRQQLDPPRVEPAAAPACPLLVAAADDADAGLASAFASRLAAPDAPVEPLFPDDPLPAAAAAAGRPVILLAWGEATRDAVDALVTRLEGPASRIVILRLPGGDARAKARFFRAGVEIEPLDQLPGSRAAARDLLQRLEIRGPAPS